MRHADRSPTAVRWAALGATLLVADVLVTPDLAAQAVVVDVQVEYIAGINLYVGAGEDRGLTVGDTVAVYRYGSDASAGTLVILSTSDSRAVLTFAGPLFPVTRGDRFMLLLPSPSGAVAESRDPPQRSPEDQSAESEASQPRADTTTSERFRIPGGVAPAPVSLPPQLSGQIAFEFDLLQSTAQAGLTESTGGPTDRRFTTPGIRFQAQLTELPGGLSVRTNLRATYRSSSLPGIEPSSSVRIFEANLQNRPGSGPLFFTLGRFHNPFEHYSGYWDGALVRLGSRSVGVGASAGFEPELWNQGFSTQMPKLSAFVDLHARGNAVSYDTDLSVHRIQPGDSLPDHTFLGWTQSLRLEGFRLNQDLQIDEDPSTSRWKVSRLRVRGSLALPAQLEVFGSYALRRPYLRWSTAVAFADRRDEVTLGLGRWGSQFYANAEATVHKYQGGGDGMTLAASFGVPNAALSGWGFGAAGNYWTQRGLRGLFISPNVSRMLGAVHVRASLQHYRTVGPVQPLVTNGGDVSLSTSLGRAVRLNVRARVQVGRVITTYGVFTGLAWRF